MRSRLQAASRNRGIDRSRCIHEGSFYDIGYPIDTNLHCVSWYTRRRGRIDLGDRSRENSEYRSCASHTSGHFDKDRSNVICNASSVLASRDIGLEKRGKKNLKRIRSRYKKKKILKIDFVARFSSRRGWSRIKDEYIRIATDRNCSWHVRPSWSWRKSIFHRDRAGIWRTFYLTLTENRRETKQVDHKRAVLAFRYRESSGAERSVGFFFFFFLLNPATPDRIIWSLLSSPKEQNASGPIRPPSPSWYMIYVLLSLSSADRGYLLIVGPERKKSSTPRDHGYHLAKIVPVRRVTSELRAGDRYNGCLARIQSVVLQ